MSEIVDLFKALDGDVGVDLGGGERGVAEQFLHTAQIGAGVEQVGGKTVTQAMRRQLGVKAAEIDVFLHHTLDGSGRDGSAVFIEKNGTAGLAIAFE